MSLTLVFGLCIVFFILNPGLVFTAPLWWLPVKLMRAKLIARQHKRITRRTIEYVGKELKEPKPINYQGAGCFFALAMDLVLAAGPVFASAGTHQFTWWGLVGVYLMAALDGLINCLLGGLLFAVLMKMMLERKGNQIFHLAFDSEGTIVPSNVSPWNCASKQEP